MGCTQAIAVSTLVERERRYLAQGAILTLMYEIQRRAPIIEGIGIWYPVYSASARSMIPPTA
jgi:hypothetical protein